VKATGPSGNEQALIVDLLQFKYDPEGFVRYAFPWGVKGTPLEKMDGPRTWQIDEFKRLGDHLMLDMEKQRIGLPPSPLYLAISSGRGIGKSAWLSMLDLFVMSCWVGSTTIVTANTETQLRSGRWPSLGSGTRWRSTGTGSRSHRRV
jgi:hypothetical protein